MGINIQYIKGYSDSVISVINGILVPMLIAVAFIVFLYGAYNYFILGADNEDKRKEGRTFALYGVIGFVIIFSLWGIVNIFMGTLNLSGRVAPAPPTIGTGSVVPAGTVSLPNAGQPAYGSGGAAGQTGYTPASLQQYNVCVAGTVPGYAQNCAALLQSQSAVGSGGQDSPQAKAQAAFQAYDNCQRSNGAVFNSPSALCDQLLQAYRDAYAAAYPSGTQSGGTSGVAPGTAGGSCDFGCDPGFTCNTSTNTCQSSNGANDACSFGGDGTKCSVNGAVGTCVGGVCYEDSYGSEFASPPGSGSNVMGFPGCTNPNARNYKPYAGKEDGSCADCFNDLGESIACY